MTEIEREIGSTEAGGFSSYRGSACPDGRNVSVGPESYVASRRTMRCLRIFCACCLFIRATAETLAVPPEKPRDALNSLSMQSVETHKSVLVTYRIHDGILEYVVFQENAGNIASRVIGGERYDELFFDSKRIDLQTEIGAVYSITDGVLTKLSRPIHWSQWALFLKSDDHRSGYPGLVGFLEKQK